MTRLGCSISGDLNDSKFSEPMPWIGIYVASASLACCAAMAADAILGFICRTLWFPCKFFSLNATSLTLIAVAVKLSMDLNTSMPRREDQLAKLSSAVFICTVMGNSMPSLGTMKSKEMFMNIMALGILVITLIVNICIQLATGAIYVFWVEQACVMFLMLVLLIILSVSAAVVPTTKLYFQSKMHELAVKECRDKTDKPAVENLKGDLIKYWMMAHTSSPQFVLGRSVTCTASGAFCLLGAMILAQAMIRSYMISWSFDFCSGESDYKSSTTSVLIIQTVVVGVGTIAPGFRWFTAINFRCPNKRNTRSIHRNNFEVESYWTQRLIELKEYPLVLRIRDRRIKKLAHAIKGRLLDLCIQVQTGIVCVSKAVQLVSIVFVGSLLLCCDWCKEAKRKLKSNTGSTNNDSFSEPQPGKNLDLRRFVLYLEGEEELVELMMKRNCDATEHWFKKGKQEQPKHLIHLLEKYVSPSQGFLGVREFDSNQVPSLHPEEPPNCWALPVVTLTSIAVALPNVDKHLTEQLLYGVNEGLMFVKLIDKHLDAKEDLINTRKAADLVWLGVDLHHKWMDVDLRKMAVQARGPCEILDQLSSTAKNRCTEFYKRDGNGFLKETPTKWPIKVMAANSMYRVCQTIQLKRRWEDDKASERLFEVLCVMICNILCACLTNLQHVLLKECVYSTIEKREERVRHAVFLLGKSERILRILDLQALPSSDPGQMACIDEWHLLRNQGSSPFDTSSENGQTSLSPQSLATSVV